MTTRGEYQDDEDFESLPLFEPRSPAELKPPSFVGDPETAKMAARSAAARRSVVGGTARCLLLLVKAVDGLTDNEAIDNYFRAYPEEVESRGAVGTFRAAIRNWAMLKPNDDPRNHKKVNLNLIQQTGVTRINPWTYRPNIVFGFIIPPTPEQVAEWTRLAYDLDAQEEP